MGEMLITEATEARQSSLHHFQERMTGLGYNTYLINSGTQTSGVSLIPVYGRFCHSDFEVCFNRSHLMALLDTVAGTTFLLLAVVAPV
jgi:hypothetical protein